MDVYQVEQGEKAPINADIIMQLENMDESQRIVAMKNIR